MSAGRQSIEAALQALEAQRPLLGDAVVDRAQQPLRAQLQALEEERPPQPAQALRQVSILFLDVVGSTTLAQRLDPEDVSAVMDGALARGTAIVEQHGGKVLQYAGDNILAAFGAEAAHEDDAERAVLCGLALLELGRQLGAEVQAEQGHAGFNVRVGVHTGGVLLGGGVDAEGTIRGSAVNIAARMEQTAPAGALRISQETYAQVRGIFEVEAQAPLEVKGVDLPVASYLVLRAKPRRFRIRQRGIEGVATRMIGREAELGALQASFLRLFEERRLAAITVVADAGIGKSRLLTEFEAWCEARPENFFIFRGRTTPQTGTLAYGLLRDVICWRFQINDDDSAELARAKLESGIVPLFEPEDGAELAEAQAHLLGHLIGIESADSRHIKGILDDPKQIRHRACHAAAQLFRRIGASRGWPVLLQLEDLHWADDESLDFLKHLVEVSSDVPLLVLSFTRPTLFERRADWRGIEGLRIELAPLGPTDSQALADELLKKLPEKPAALRQLLTGGAEGNPFYMEELVKMLIDQGIISKGETWAVDPQRLQVTQVPPTLTGVLQARLDGLPAAEKRALQHASVVGAVFWDQALAAIEERATNQLPALAQRELALPRADAPLQGLREFAFRHHVLHQVTYDTVLKRHKREGHARVARWLAGFAEQGGALAMDTAGLAAQHFEWAGDNAQAAEFHTRAAENAARRVAHERVLAHVSRALALLGETAPGLSTLARAEHADICWRLLSVREQTYQLNARRDEQAVDLLALGRLADVLDDNRRRADVAWRRALAALRSADWPTAAHQAREGMARAAQAGDDGLRLNAMRYLALVQMYQGDIDGGQALAESGLAEARSLGLRFAEARMINTLLVAAEMKGDLLQTVELSRQNLLIFREVGDRVNEATSLSNLGGGWLNLGDLEQAGRDLHAALGLLRANADRVMEAAALCNLATLHLWQDDPGQALSLARRALGLARAVRSAQMQVAAGLRQGDAEWALGLRDEAWQTLLQSRTLAVQIGSGWQNDACANLARLALAEGDVQAALAHLQPVLELAAGAGSVEGSSEPRFVELTCCQVLLAAQDPQAADWLARAHGALMAQAQAITDATLREGFLRNIPHARDIVALWAERTERAALQQAAATAGPGDKLALPGRT